MFSCLVHIPYVIWDEARSRITPGDPQSVAALVSNRISRKQQTSWLTIWQGGKFERNNCDFLGTIDLLYNTIRISWSVQVLHESYLCFILSDNMLNSRYYGFDIKISDLNSVTLRNPTYQSTYLCQLLNSRSCYVRITYVGYLCFVTLLTDPV